MSWTIFVGFCGKEARAAHVQLASAQPLVCEVLSLIPSDISPFCVALTTFKHPQNGALMEREVK